MEVLPIEVLEYVTRDWKRPFTEWMDSLNDNKTRLIIDKRLAALRKGNLGDSKFFEHILELRIDYGPGYRIYCGKKGKALVVLLCGGDKKSQKRDIEVAKEYWKDYHARSS